MKYELVIINNQDNSVLYETIIEADKVYDAAEIADKIFVDLKIDNSDITMELKEKNAW